MSVRLRVVVESDLDAAAALVAQVFGRPVPPEGGRALRWLLFENPDAAPDIPKGWVLEQGEELVGFLANVPRRMVLDGREVVAACTAKYVVRPDQRFYGLLLAREYFGQTNVGFLFISTGSEASNPILLRFGAETIAGGAAGAVFVLRPGGVVGELLTRRGLPTPLVRTAALGAAAAGPLNRLRYHLPAVPPGLEVAEVTSFDQQADELWGRIGANGRIRSVRTRERLNWLFCTGAARPETLVLGATRGGRLQGFLVCQDRGWTHEVRRRHVMDVFAPTDDLTVFDALVGEAGRRALRARMHTLEFRNLEPVLMARVGTLGAHPRTLDVNPMLARAVKGGQALPCAAADRWSLTPSDGDGAGR